MKKKIFLIVGSLGAGGSERVYWLLSQYFNKDDYEVSVVFLNAGEQCFSTNIEGIQFIDLKTVKASRSFFKLYKLLKAAKPFAVFSTTDHINILTAMVACFLKVPHLIARASNNPQQMKQFYGYKARFYNLFTRFLAVRFNFIVCQSAEMQQSISRLYGISSRKLKVISNPVLHTPVIKKQLNNTQLKKLIVVARLSPEKGLFRLIEVMQGLPSNYILTMVGGGPLMADLQAEVSLKGLHNRVTFLGEINEVSAQVVQHDLLVLCSFTEGFPNVVLEALALGVPAVTFRVGGTNELIQEGFNGYVAEQDNIAQLRNLIIRACTQSWQHEAIKADAYNRFSLDKIGQAYESLLQD
ncbi:glycosyltransferase family 4 protein [Mucilaginibacter aquaedulcis]|jgi:glycosyltransferase involved in cell wall biosynthesis|uniref:glycosyltransferase family 4 protein n=1 Tax=Mucilaginibacter aquaedulcis TaxID=1187081 RepID=UPI0025B3C41E|nr:glycosyltransferase family 4 protein [Mucilaginibacter aquaedulcis]MDN3549562.1 glycosyltransferase family 4 protein [Mucilaginibacter aquaedulcis]